MGNVTKWLNVDDAAALVGMHPNSLRRLLQKDARLILAGQPSHYFSEVRFTGAGRHRRWEISEASIKGYTVKNGRPKNGEIRPR